MNTAPIFSFRRLSRRELVDTAGAEPGEITGEQSPDGPLAWRILGVATQCVGTLIVVAVFMLPG